MSLEKQIIGKPQSSGRPLPNTLSGAPSLVYIPLKVAFTLDGTA
jgi:hypothetical protein